MKKTQTHALSRLLDAFLQPLGEKFSRIYSDTKLTPSVTAISILMMVVNTTQSGYESVMRQLRLCRPDLTIDEPSTPAFCRARRKLNHGMLTQAWESLRACMCQLFDDVHPMVYGRRLVAIDGMVLNTKRSRKLFRQLQKKKRGRPRTKHKGQPQLTIVALVDVFTKTPIAWVELTPGTGERSAVQELLQHLDARCILLADRGFPSKEILGLLRDSGVFFIMRMVNGNGGFGEIMAASFPGSRKDKTCLIAYGKNGKDGNMEARIVRGIPKKIRKDDRKNKKHDEWSLLTNLPKNKRWTKSVIMELYHERWAIETFFDEFKNIMLVEDFHSQTLDGIRQEITFAMLSGALTAAADMMASIITHGKNPAWNDPYKKVCNRATLVTTIRCLLIIDPRHRDLAADLDDALGISFKRAQKRRPGRWYPRICKSFYGKWKSGFHKEKF